MGEIGSREQEKWIKEDWDKGVGWPHPSDSHEDLEPEELRKLQKEMNSAVSDDELGVIEDPVVGPVDPKDILEMKKLGLENKHDKEKEAHRILNTPVGSDEKTVEDFLFYKEFRSENTAIGDKAREVRDERLRREIRRSHPDYTEEQVEDALAYRKFDSGVKKERGLVNGKTSLESPTSASEVTLDKEEDWKVKDDWDVWKEKTKREWVDQKKLSDNVVDLTHTEDEDIDDALKTALESVDKLGGVIQIDKDYRAKVVKNPDGENKIRLLKREPNDGKGDTWHDLNAVYSPKEGQTISNLLKNWVMNSRRTQTNAA